MAKYKELYEWEKASHLETEQELQRFKKMYAELSEKVERCKKALSELENGFDEFGKITGDKRFVHGVRRVKKKYGL